jgi:two-component system response regulator DevR
MRKKAAAHRCRIAGSQRDLRWSIRAGRISRMIRLVVADNQELIRLGLRAMLAGEPGLSIRGEAGTLAEAVAETRRLRADLLLLEYHLPDGSGAEACRLLLKENSRIRILIMTWDKGMAVFRNAVKAGTHGFVYKDIGRADLLQAIRLVARGKSYLNSMGMNQPPRAIHRKGHGSHRSGLHLLSPQESRILPLIAVGKTNQEIALDLALAERTVKNYIANMFKKLHVSRRAQAAAVYLRAQ